MSGCSRGVPLWLWNGLFMWNGVFMLINFSFHGLKPCLTLVAWSCFLHFTGWSEIKACALLFKNPRVQWRGKIGVYPLYKLNLNQLWVNYLSHWTCPPCYFSRPSRCFAANKVENDNWQPRKVFQGMSDSRQFAPRQCNKPPTTSPQIMDLSFTL